MKKGLLDLWKWKIGNWFEEPLGERTVLTVPEPEVKKPSKLTRIPRVEPKLVRESSYSKETGKNVPEFHPRGSAAHREIYTLPAHHKGVLPFAGKGVKHPK